MRTYIIYRLYFPNSTVGVCYESTQAGYEFVFFTVELPWMGNKKNASCIPEREYIATYERHPKFGDAWRLSDVEGRDGILIHAANKRTQLRGCIAPNLTLVSDQAGLNSRKAIDLLPKETIKIIIQKSPYGPEK
jgi:hypothetical protein